MHWLEATFGTRAPLVGVVHLAPLPGSAGYGGSDDEIMRLARDSAAALWDAGFDGIMLENFGDTPFHPDSVEPHVVGLVSVLVREFSARGPCGVNLLRNAARDALAAAFAGGGAFIRVNIHTGAALTDQGVIQGRAWETLRYRRVLGARVGIMADIQVKHAVPLAPRDPVEEARDSVERGLADALIVTGPRTGTLGNPARARALKEALPDVPVFMGSGVNHDNVGRVLEDADGVIVSSALESGCGRIDPARAAAFVKAARGANRHRRDHA